MRNFVSNRFLGVIIAIVVICLGIAIYSSTADGNAITVSSLGGVIVSPIQKVVSTVSNKVGNVFKFFTAYGELEKENEALKKQLGELEQKVREGEDARTENSNLRSMLGVKQRNTSFVLEMSEVIARSPGDGSLVLTLDKGTLADIAVGDCVVSAEGYMVGMVANVAPNYCEVTSVIDPDMSAGALVSRTRDVGVAQGDYKLMVEDKLRLSYLDSTVQLLNGDKVETSGRGGVLPKGIIIGTIESVKDDEGGSSIYAIVQPAIDVKKISNVFIIKDFEVTE